MPVRGAVLDAANPMETEPKMIPRRWAYTYEGEWKELEDAFRSGTMPDDRVVPAWEQAVADYVGVPHAAAVNSGRRGMTLIFEHLGLGMGDEVIVPAYTLGDLIPLIQRFGTKVVPADIDPDTYCLDPAEVEKRLSERTKAILALHTFGAPCAIDEIMRRAAERNIPVIEDCAHSLGAAVRGRQTGSFGYAGFFSFEPTKPINTYGGGMVVTRDESLINHIRQKTAQDTANLESLQQKVKAVRTEQRLFSTGLAFPFLFMLASPALRSGLSRLYRNRQHVPPGNVRYSPLQAHLGLKKLTGLRQRIENRDRVARQFRSLLKPEIRTQRIEDGCMSPWYFFVAVLPCPAARLRRKLLLRGIDAGIEEEIADDCAASLGYGDCPKTRALFRNAIALPMYDGMDEKTVERVAKTLNAVVA